MLYDTQKEGTIAERQQADLKVARTLGDSLLHVLQDLLSNHQQLRLAGEGCSMQRQAQALARPLNEQDALLERLKDITLAIRAATFNKLFRQMKALSMDMARRCGKELDLHMEGADLAVDVAVLEALEDPLALLVRRAVEHGLEPPAQRLAAGKPAKGRLEVLASCQNGAVRVEVRDDGHGADTCQDGASAPRAGLGRIEEAMAALHGSFCLKPGQNGGTVAVCSIPLAFQFLDGVVFQAGAHRIVVPMGVIAALQPLRAADLTMLQQHAVLSCDRGTIPFLDLASLLDGRAWQTLENKTPPQAVILNTASGTRLALGVAAVRGRYRGAVSPLAPCCAWHPSLGGCVLLTGGDIGFVLDVDALQEEVSGPRLHC
ncbi:MAG: chemotaxis protein CheW [Desulfovibrio sp.]|nr:chemotaxis protein CheW [Desulfovibrio sp.]